jgi:DNA-binding MarR family transcriptional regulator
VQVSPSTTEALALDVYNFAANLLKSGNADVFRSLADLELSLTQVKVLHMIEDAEEGELSIGQVAESVGLSLPAASRSVDGLLTRGFVERREDPHDRRARRVRILPAGTAITRALHEARLTVCEAFVAGLAPEDADRLQAALTPILADPAMRRSRP